MLESVTKWGLRISIYCSIVCLRANHAVYLLPPELSQLRLLRTEDTSLALDIFMQLKKKAAAHNKTTVKISHRQRPSMNHSNTPCHGSMF